MIKSFSGQAVFCFAILRAISAYIGENWLSQYTWEFLPWTKYQRAYLPERYFGQKAYYNNNTTTLSLSIG